MKRLSAFLLSLLLPIAALAQSPGVGLDALPSASALGGGELIFMYQPGAGGGGAAICARGWCPVSATPLQVATYITGLGRFTTITGAITTGHCVEWASATALQDAGAACGSGGGGGITQLTGDVTAGPGSGSQTATVIQISGAAIPASAAALATNSSRQLIAATTVPLFTGSFTATHCVNVSSGSPVTFADAGSACGSGGGGSFSGITSGTNTTAAMVVGTGGSLSSSGSGTIAATTAVALASGPAQCTGVQFSTGVDVGGNANCATIPSGGTFDTIGSGTNTTAAMIVGTGGTLTTSGSGTIAATTAVALAASPAQCTGVQFATGINAGGTANCATPAGSGNVSNIGTPTSGQLPLWGSATTLSGTTIASGTLIGNAGSGIAALTPPQVIGVLNAVACNNQTASYLAILTDANGCITETSSSATTVTIQPSGTVAMPIGTTLTIEQLGTGPVSITLGSGVTAPGPGPWVATASLGGQNGYIQLQQVSTDVWAVVGYAPGNAKFTVGGSCSTPAATAGGAAGGTITLAASGTVNSCTLIVTPGAGMTTQTLLVGRMSDRNQLTVPPWGESASSTTAITFTIPAATAASDVLTFSLTPE